MEKLLTQEQQNEIKQYISPYITSFANKKTNKVYVILSGHIRGLNNFLEHMINKYANTKI